MEQLQSHELRNKRLARRETMDASMKPSRLRKDWNSHRITSESRDVNDMHTSMPRLTNITRAPAMGSSKLSIPPASWIPAYASPVHVSSKVTTPIYKTLITPITLRTKMQRRAIVNSLKAFDRKPLTTLAIL